MNDDSPALPGFSKTTNKKIVFDWEILQSKYKMGISKYRRQVNKGDMVMY